MVAKMASWMNGIVMVWIRYGKKALLCHTKVMEWPRKGRGMMAEGWLKKALLCNKKR